MDAGQGRVRLHFEGWNGFHATCVAVVVLTSGMFSTGTLTNTRKPNELNSPHHKHWEPKPSTELDPFQSAVAT